MLISRLKLTQALKNLEQLNKNFANQKAKTYDQMQDDNATLSNQQPKANKVKPLVVWYAPNNQVTGRVRS